MISIIVCHRDQDLLARFVDNINRTVGEEYEIVVVENANNQHSIFSAYNEGVKRSQFSTLVFVHEDVAFHTPKWGSRLLAHLQDQTIGMVGTIGGTYFPSFPAPWWNSEPGNVPLLNVIQHGGEKRSSVKWVAEVIEEDKGVFHQYHNPFGNMVEDVVTLDGVFFAMPKHIFSKIRFDENTFKGFHCYDTDTCFQVLQNGLRVVVVFDILLEHFSMGTINKGWAEAANNLVKKWQTALPVDARNRNFPTSSGAAGLLTYCYWMKSAGFSDNETRKAIAAFLPAVGGSDRTKPYLLLFWWKQLGYKLARLPYKIFKVFYK